MKATASEVHQTRATSYKVTRIAPFCTSTAFPGINYSTDIYTQFPPTKRPYTHTNILSPLNSQNNVECICTWLSYFSGRWWCGLVGLLGQQYMGIRQGIFTLNRQPHDVHRQGVIGLPALYYTNQTMVTQYPSKFQHRLRWRHRHILDVHCCTRSAWLISVHIGCSFLRICIVYECALKSG